MIRLNAEQQTTVDWNGNVVVTACPGSGKTRVLTARVIRGLSDLDSDRQRVVALTFTNRATDQIRVRLDEANVAADCLWAGTIHAFALEWVLRPYASYSDMTRCGFTVADEFHTERLLDVLKKERGLPGYTEISTRLTRTGGGLNADAACRAIASRYKAELRKAKMVDFDDVLYIAYNMLEGNPAIAATLASIIRLFCVDEVQDIQDLQFGILSTIFRAAACPVSLFFVGDGDQSIYESLGALAKTPDEIADEFGVDGIEHLELRGNYRSTQRIIDYYRRLRPGVPPIESRVPYAECIGTITFQDQTIPKEGLAAVIAVMISDSLSAGVAMNDICVLAPHWRDLWSLARSLVGLLPHVRFDAPGLSPLHSSRDNFWFKVGRLFLTGPSPSRTRTRFRWATEVLSDLCALADTSLPETIDTPRRLLRRINAISSGETEGMSYLRDVFTQFMVCVGLDLDSSDALNNSFDTFFEKAESRIATADGGMPTDVDSFRRLFSHPSGVVVSTCHGVKGQEYDTVIAFGLLKGYVPNWAVIIKGSSQASSEQESKLLYVVCSRAKRRLHLIAESGRKTRRGNPYETANLLKQVRFNYDEVDGSDHGER